MMVLQAFLAVAVPVPRTDGSRASKFLVWDSKKQLTFDAAGEHIGETAIDSAGNIHCVWINTTGVIYYGKTDSSGVFIGNKRVLGTSNRGYAANLRLSLDVGDRSYITWSNDSGPQNKRVFEYIRLTTGGSIISVKHGAGGDDILGDSTGFIALRFANVSGPSPPAYGPIAMFFYDVDGNYLKNITVGYHRQGFEHAEVLRNATGDIFVVYLMDGSVMNLTKVQGQAVTLDQKTLLSGRVNMVSPRMAFDTDGNLHVVWIDGVPNPAYDDAGIYRMKLRTDGSPLIPAGLLAKSDRTTYKPEELALLDARTYDDFPVMARGHYTDMGSGGSEIPDFYFFIDARKDGTAGYNKTDFKVYCSDNAPSLAQDGPGQFIMFWGERYCYQEGSGPKPYEDLYFQRSLGYHFIDLAVNASEVQYPSRIFPGEQFTFNLTVRNLGDWDTTPFFLNLTDMGTGQLVSSSTASLGPGGNLPVHLKFSLDTPVTYSINVDPSKNPDINLSNNKVVVTLTPIPRPDLEITSDNISFSNVRPNRGEQTEIMAHISNLGGPGAGADVLFFDGINGTFIGKGWIDFNTTMTITSVFWKPKAVGIRTLVVKITNITPAELPGHDANNAAMTTLLVGSQNIPSIAITTPAKGAMLEASKFNVTGQAWDPDGDDLEVFVRLDGGAWEQAASRPNSTIKGLDWFIVWDFSGETENNHSLMAQVTDDIHENTTFIVIAVVKYLVPFKVTDWTPRKDPTINETEWVIFGVTVDNPHNLNISYEWTVDGEVLNNTSRLNLTTRDNSAGTYNVTVNVTYGKLFWTHSWKLTIVHKNKPPTITSFSPTDDPVHLRDPTTVTFTLVVSDPEGDTLNYTWTTGGTMVNATGGKANIRFQTDGDFFVNVTVSDGKGGLANHSWTVHYKYMKPPCCGPTPHYDTALDSMVLIFIVIFGIIAMTCVAVIYVRLGRAGKDKKGKAAERPEEPRLPGRRI